MRNKGKTAYECCVCWKITSTLHEVFFGNGKRPICEEFNIQVPLCVKHHAHAHGREIDMGHGVQRFFKYDNYNQEECIEYFCKVHEIDLMETRLAINTPADLDHLNKIAPKCLETINRYESHCSWY